MMNDSVREELKTKMASGPIQRDVLPPTATAFEREPAKPNPKPVRTITTELNRQKTSPTLVEFQTKNATLPDWRLQLQNAVRHRKAGGAESSETVAYQAQLVTNGANALKAEYVEQQEAEKPVAHADPRVAAALNRIDKSRQTFLPEASSAGAAAVKPAEPRYPFNVVSRNGAKMAPAPELKAAVNVAPKPRLVPTITLKKGGYDTNKLPPLPAKDPISSFDIQVPVDVPVEKPAIKLNLPTPEVIDESPVVAERVEVVEPAVETDAEYDDLAPMAMRFNAGLFDFIIGLFTSLLLLSPIAFAGGNWMSGAGLLTLMGTCAIVMFGYLTLSIALFGKTAGMKLFSLEVVDADLSEYPTFHQAAVSSAVYLMTLPLAGIGFLTIPFNDEKRAAHDLLSGTIIVSEF